MNPSDVSPAAGTAGFHDPTVATVIRIGRCTLQYVLNAERTVKSHSSHVTVVPSTAVIASVDFEKANTAIQLE